MTTDEARICKRQAEDGIKAILEAFESQTGYRVKDISIRSLDADGIRHSEHIIAEVKLDVRI